MEQTLAKRSPGRPKADHTFDRLIHVRITGDMDEYLSVIADERLDKPTTAQLVREALAQFIEKEREKNLRFGS